MKDLDGLIARVEQATLGRLDVETSIEIHALGLGGVFVSLDSAVPHRGDDGGDEWSFLIDLPSGRARRYVNESELPDRSVDAAIGLMERVLPMAGWERIIQPDNTVLVYVWGEDSPGKAFEKASGTALALILATLRALQSKPEGDAR